MQRWHELRHPHAARPAPPDSCASVQQAVWGVNPEPARWRASRRSQRSTTSRWRRPRSRWSSSASPPPSPCSSGLVGLYGVIAYIVAQRRREVGIRMALGAGGGDVQRMFVWRGLQLAGIGLVVGVVAAAAVTRFLSALLFGVSPFDPVTYAAVVLALWAWRCWPRGCRRGRPRWWIPHCAPRGVTRLEQIRRPIDNRETAVVIVRDLPTSQSPHRIADLLLHRRLAAVRLVRRCGPWRASRSSRARTGGFSPAGSRPARSARSRSLAAARPHHGRARHCGRVAGGGRRRRQRLVHHPPGAARRARRASSTPKTCSRRCSTPSHAACSARDSPTCVRCWAEARTRACRRPAWTRC